MPSSHFPDAGSASTVVTEAPILGDGSAGDPVSFDATDITVGTNKQIIFNDSGVLAGNAAFTFDKATGLVGFTSGHGLAFATITGNPLLVVGGTDGFGDAALVFSNPIDGYGTIRFANDFDIVVNGRSAFYGPTHNAQFVVDDGAGTALMDGPLGVAIHGPVTDQINLASTRPLALTVEEGTPGAGTVNIFMLGGTTDADIFMAAVDAQPGDDDTNPNRDLVLFARPATASHHIAGASLFLYGSHWNGASSDFIGFEIENKVRTTGLPELWLEQSGGHPFMRFFWDQSTTGIMAAHDQDGYVLSLRAYDVDGAAYKSFIALQSANTPTMTIAPPSGGTVSIQSTTYKSSDGTTGATAGIVVPTVGTLTFKNGLYVGLV